MYVNVSEGRYLLTVALCINFGSGVTKRTKRQYIHSQGVGRAKQRRQLYDCEQEVLTPSF